VEWDIRRSQKEYGTRLPVKGNFHRDGQIVGQQDYIFKLLIEAKEMTVHGEHFWNPLVTGRVTATGISSQFRGCHGLLVASFPNGHLVEATIIKSQRGPLPLVAPLGEGRAVARIIVVGHGAECCGAEGKRTREKKRGSSARRRRRGKRRGVKLPETGKGARTQKPRRGNEYPPRRGRRGLKWGGM
jgi:hypothetical protein